MIASSPFGATQISPAPSVGIGGPPVDHNGAYSGIAVPLDTAGGLCIRNRPVSGFRVTGDRVRWGQFHGRIERGGVQMVYGNTWVFGQFEGERFNGQISTTAPRGPPGCSYAIELTKTGH